jgi:hypothetical protein
LAHTFPGEGFVKVDEGHITEYVDENWNGAGDMGVGQVHGKFSESNVTSDPGSRLTCFEE